MHEADGDRTAPLALVVDDDTGVRLLLRAALENDGLRVAEAGDGASALELFDRLRPDIVALDVMMPEPDGFATCVQLRQRPHGQRTPVLMMTGLDDEESISRAFACGATDFITKPINGPIVPHRVRYILRASRAMLELAGSQARLADAQRMAHLGNWEWDLACNHASWSEEIDRILGREPGEVRPSRDNYFSFVHPEDRDRFDRELCDALSLEGVYRFDHRVVRPDGTVRAVHVQARVQFQGEDRQPLLQGTVQDVSERVAAQEKIRRLANFDDLTGLPNRQHFRERLGSALARAKRAGRLVAILFLDLDRFKRINDSFGHSVGDILLMDVSGRLAPLLRGSDYLARDAEDVGEEVSLARLGGDEFIALLPDLVHTHDAAHVAQRLIEAFSQPFDIADREVFITASIGIALYPNDGDDGEILLKNADVAMYHAKDRGRNNYQYYDNALNAAAIERLTLESSLRLAMDRGEFVLHYQPQVDAMAGKVIAVEALVRWRHPELGLVSPADFIPVAEETGLIVPLGEWVLSEACRQNMAWQRAGIPPMRVAVNVSGLQFERQALIPAVSKALRESGLEAEWLELEVTESTIMRDVPATLAVMDQLKAMGLTLAVDDFGTGYSSLSYLRRFPLDTLKIDRAFVRDVADSPDGAAIASAIIAMADSLNLSVVAEGVEVEEQAAFLLVKGCTVMQGYLYSRPLSAETLVSWLHEREH